MEGFVTVRLPTMEQSSDESTKAKILFNAGRFREALPQFYLDLAIAQEDRNTIKTYMWIVLCHVRLEEVSLPKFRAVANNLTFCCTACGRVAPLRQSGANGKTCERAQIGYNDLVDGS